MKELLKTVLRFAIWAMLFIVTMFAGMIVLSITHPSVWQGSELAATEYFKDSVVTGWINLAATLLFIILFLILRWASLSKGILERTFMWKLVGLLVLLTVSDVCFEVFLMDLPAYHNLFPESWAVSSFSYIKPQPLLYLLAFGCKLYIILFLHQTTTSIFFLL